MIAAVIGLILVAVLLTVAAGWIRRYASRHRLDEWLSAAGEAAPSVAVGSRGLNRWLGLAGYWSPSATFVFLMAEVAAIALGLFVVWLLTISGVVLKLADSVATVPGGVGEAFATVLGLAPWIVFLTVALAPVLHVRAARRRVIREVEADLPLVLEIFATLAEAGLGFDASLMRLLDATPDNRPLHRAFLVFHRDIRAGVPRVPALRQLATRLDVSSVTVFVSAIVQAEHVGAGIAGTLRRQADDVRDRRRERVAMLGQLLPVKLMFPLVVCFLPGIFLTTLGPALLQLVEVAGGFLR